MVRNSLTTSGLCLLQGVFDRYFSVCTNMQVKQWACLRGCISHKTPTHPLKKKMGADLIHDGVEVLLPSAVFIFPTVLPLLLEVCQEFEDLRGTKTEWQIQSIITVILDSESQMSVEILSVSPHSC